VTVYVEDAGRRTTGREAGQATKLLCRGYFRALHQVGGNPPPDPGQLDHPSKFATEPSGEYQMSRGTEHP
jgi:hypothetical protein